MTSSYINILNELQYHEQIDLKSYPSVIKPEDVPEGY